MLPLLHSNRHVSTILMAIFSMVKERTQKHIQLECVGIIPKYKSWYYLCCNPGKLQKYLYFYSCTGHPEMTTLVAETFRWSLYNKGCIHETKVHSFVILIIFVHLINARNIEHDKPRRNLYARYWLCDWGFGTDHFIIQRNWKYIACAQFKEHPPYHVSNYWPAGTYICRYYNYQCKNLHFAYH